MAGPESIGARSATRSEVGWHQASQSARHRTAGPQRYRLRNQNERRVVTLVHKGNIMKFTEGGFRDWGYEVAKDSMRAEPIDGGPWCQIPKARPGAGSSSRT